MEPICTRERASSCSSSPLSCLGAGPDDLIQARIYAAAREGGRIGLVNRSAGVWPAVKLGTADTPVIWVSVVDRAGNESDAVRVAEGEWVATLGGKEPGDFFSNPHSLIRTPGLLGSLAQDVDAAAAPSKAEYRRISSADGSTLLVEQTRGWRRRGRTSAVPQENGGVVIGGSAFDRARGRVVYVNPGFPGFSSFGQILEWADAARIETSPQFVPAQPKPKYFYAPSVGRTLLEAFGCGDC